MNRSTEGKVVGEGVLRPIGKLTTVDVSDSVQAVAQERMGYMLPALLNDCGQVSLSQVPSFADRVLLQYIHQVISLLGYSKWLLLPATHTFIRAPLVAHVIRSLVDIYARWLYVRDQPDPEIALRGLFVDSIDKAILAMEGANGAGHDVTKDINHLKDNKRILQAGRCRPIIVDILAKHDECEMLTAYRWESGHVHTGFATIAAHGQTLSSGALTMDVGLSPLSLWRVGQLTWASYGIALRTVTALGSRIGLPLAAVRRLDTHVRPQVRAAATRARDSDEPISPPYGDFEFPLWSVPAETST